MRFNPRRNASAVRGWRGAWGMRQRLDGSLQLFASDIDDREGGGDAIKSERASTTLRETEKKFASKFRRCIGGVRGGLRQTPC